MTRSPFHDVPEGQWLASNATGFAIWDRFPVNPGHALVVPHRLVGTWWDLSDAEQAGLFALVAEARAVIDGEFRPEGYNVGFNDGVIAGQTVGQLHVHVIPRYAGDVDDPRGGVRHVIPGRGNYLAATGDPQPSG